MIARLLRAAHVVRRPTVTAEQAMALAKVAVAERGWAWREPVKVSESLNAYRVWTNSSSRGGNVFVYVDARTGEVIKAGATPR